MARVKRKFYTDGVKTIKLAAGDPIPDGYHLGRTFKVATWNKGLTKEDPRVAKNTENCHKTRKQKNNYHSWNKGLKKDTSPSLQRVADKLSKFRKEHPRTQEQLDDMCKHIYETKKKNNSFNISKPEEDYYQFLLTQFDETDILRQYRDPRYPFNCDFYIKSKDLFIECNYSWCHGKHPFDPTNSKDLEIATQKKQKAETSSYHKWALKIWTESDVLKLKVLRENNLNFKLIYPKGLIIEK